MGTFKPKCLPSCFKPPQDWFLLLAFVGSVLTLMAALGERQ